MSTSDNHYSDYNNNISHQQPQQIQQPQQTHQIRLVDIPINDENTALNVMVSFLDLANKRGVFSLDESSKIWECIKKFQRS